MTDEPLVWHYGLMAERWAEFITEAPEAPYFLDLIARFGQPVLDLGCGAGRVLVPILRAGIDIDGCDISADMLRQCQARAAREGFQPGLFAQPMHAFDLPRTYQVIYICGSFGLGGSLEYDLEALRRCHAHLGVGGALVFDIDVEYSDPESWALWLRDRREALPQPWPDMGKGRVASDGSEHFGRFRILAMDPLEQTITRQVHLEKWQAGARVASEEYTLRAKMYFKNEVLLMLRLAGFSEVDVYGDYTDARATSDHKQLIFVARR